MLNPVKIYWEILLLLKEPKLNWGEEVRKSVGPDTKIFVSWWIYNHWKLLRLDFKQ